MYETFYKNCSHFILKLFQPNSFEEVSFLEESYKNMQKFKFWLKIWIWEGPLFDMREYAFNCNSQQLCKLLDMHHWTQIPLIAFKVDIETCDISYQKLSCSLVCNLHNFWGPKIRQLKPGDQIFHQMSDFCENLQFSLLMS